MTPTSSPSPAHSEEVETTHRTFQVSTVVVLAFLLGSQVTHTQESATEAAQTSTEAWLSLVDSQSYAASWDAAAGLFKNAVTREEWQATAQAAREPLGQVQSRTLQSATSSTTLPGAPDGEYVVFQFNASYEHKSAAVETVTAVQEDDDTWHVGGYFIK